METEFKLKYNKKYFKKDCGVCGKDRLCYSICEKGNPRNIRGYICRNCKEKWMGAEDGDN